MMSSELRKRHNMVSSFSNFSDKVCSMAMLNGDVKGEELQDLSFFSMIGVYGFGQWVVHIAQKVAKYS